ncbi:hypothetical protein EDD85DRAFT_784310 [Armillaria nabsnona]|nr:hypothetical protein EDD85DRAFT_784310 [Armillaria nabsnona]
MDPFTIPDAIIERLLSVYRWHKIAMTTTVFSFTWTWWEFAITLDDEQSKWSWIKFLFFTTFDLICILMFGPGFKVIFFRNLLITHEISYPLDRFIRMMIVGLAWVGYITIIDGTLQVFIADIILIIRLAAIYGRKKRVIVPVVVLYILTVAASSTVLAIQARNATGTNQPLPGIYLCTLTSKLNILYAYWQVFSSRVTTDFNGPKVLSAYGPLSLLAIVARDSLFYFVVVLITGLSNALEYRFASPGKYNVLHGPTSAALSISMSRMILNLRKTGQQEMVPPSLPLSTLQFQGDRNRGTTIDTGDDGAITDQTN